MKKYILLIVALISFSLAGKCWTKIEKYNGGFFGYRTVSESTSGPNSILACADPGRNRCNFSTGFTVVGNNGAVVKYDDFSPIETEVMKHITRENTSGSFIYSSDLLVQYTYIIETGKLTMQIYGVYEAQSLGLL
jgi:hypothetical protein